MHKPLISVIIPFGGDGDVIQTLTSIRNQATVETEIIVVTRKYSAHNYLLQAQSDICVVQELQPGVYGALNTGLALAKGKFCCFLSSGAFFNTDNVLREYVSLFQRKPQISFVNSGWVQRRNGGELSIFRGKKIKKFSHFWSVQPVNIEAICFLRNKTGIFFDEKYHIAADFKFIRTLLSEGGGTSMEFEAVTLPPPGLSGARNHNGEGEVSAIRIEFLQIYFGKLSPYIESSVLLLLKFPGFIKAWSRIITKKLLKNHL